MPSGTIDFTGSNGASAPSPFIFSTGGSTSGSIQSNKFRFNLVTGYARASLRYGSVAYTDTLVTAEFTGPSTNLEAYGSLNIRASGGWNSTFDNAYAGYYLSISYLGDQIDLSRCDAGSLTSLDSRAFTFNTAGTYTVKFEATGTTIRYKVWETSGSEPGSWTFSTTDSTYADGFWCVSASANSTATIDVDNVVWSATESPYAVWWGNGPDTGDAAGITPSFPADYGPDDVAFLFLEATGGGSISLTTANGFAQIANSPIGTGSGTAGTQLGIYWNRLTSSSHSSPVTADAGNHIFGFISIFGNVKNTGNPWDVSANGTKASASTSMTLPAVTTSNATELIVLVASRDTDDSGPAGSNPSNANLTSITERFDAGTTSGNGGGIMIWTGKKATAGDTGTTSATVLSSINAYITFALLTQPPSVTGIALGSASATLTAYGEVVSERSIGQPSVSLTANVVSSQRSQTNASLTFAAFDQSLIRSTSIGNAGLTLESLNQSVLRETAIEKAIDVVFNAYGQTTPGRSLTQVTLDIIANQLALHIQPAITTPEVTLSAFDQTVETLLGIPLGYASMQFSAFDQSSSRSINVADISLTASDQSTDSPRSISSATVSMIAGDENVSSRTQNLASLSLSASNVTAALREQVVSTLSFAGFNTSTQLITSLQLAELLIAASNVHIGQLEEFPIGAAALALAAFPLTPFISPLLASALVDATAVPLTVAERSDGATEAVTTTAFGVSSPRTQGIAELTISANGQSEIGSRTEVMASIAFGAFGLQVLENMIRVKYTIRGSINSVTIDGTISSMDIEGDVSSRTIDGDVGN